MIYLINETKITILKLMYICLCNGITEKMLEDAMKDGRPTNEALRSLGVGSDCGICLLQTIEKLAARSPRTKSPPKKKSS